MAGPLLTASEAAPVSSATPISSGASPVVPSVVPAPAPSTPQVDRTSTPSPPPSSNPSLVPTSFTNANGASPSGEFPDLRATTLYLNRELSWLEFNARVLDEAEAEVVPLLERLKFHAIVASNLDEFFMVRVAGLKQQLTGEVGELAADGLSAHEQLVKISMRAHELVAQQMASLMGNLLPRLASDGTFVLLKPEQLPPDTLAVLDERFHNEVFPILTPIAIDPGHPFPHVRNKSLNLGVMLSREGETEPGFGVVQVPMMLPRLIEVQGNLKTDGGVPTKHAFVLLEDLIARHVGTIFPGVKLKGVYAFRVTRNFDLEIDEEEAQDLLQTIQQELRRRGARRRRASRGDRRALHRFAHQARSRAEARSRSRRVPHAVPQRVGPHGLGAARRAPRSPRGPVQPAARSPAARLRGHLRGHPRERHPAPSPVRVVRSGDRARHARRGGSRRARDQADPLPRRR